MVEAPVATAGECAEAAAAALHTAPLRLRLLDESDRALYHALHSSPEVMRAIGPTLAADEIDARFGRVVRHNRSARPGHRAWVIEAEPAAAAGLITLLRNGAQAELGVMLLPARWARGVATAAIACLLPHAFSVLGLLRIEAARPDDAHARVIDRLLLPLGFHRTTGAHPGEARWGLSAPARPDGRF